jgi:hypothetical protein
MKQAFRATDNLVICKLCSCVNLADSRSCQLKAGYNRSMRKTIQANHFKSMRKPHATNQSALIKLLNLFIGRYGDPQFTNHPSFCSCIVTIAKSFVTANHVPHAFSSTPVELPFFRSPRSTISPICRTSSFPCQVIDVTAISIKFSVPFVLDDATSIEKSRSTSLVSESGGTCQHH